MADIVFRAQERLTGRESVRAVDTGVCTTIPCCQDVSDLAV